jgi:hypothetical protein
MEWLVQPGAGRARLPPDLLRMLSFVRYIITGLMAVKITARHTKGSANPMLPQHQGHEG